MLIRAYWSVTERGEARGDGLWRDGVGRAISDGERMRGTGRALGRARRCKWVELELLRKDDWWYSLGERPKSWILDACMYVTYCTYPKVWKP